MSFSEIVCSASITVNPPTETVRVLVTLRRFLRAHAVVPELPVALALRGTGAIWLETASGAGPEPARAQLETLLKSAVGFGGFYGAIVLESTDAQ